MRKQSLNSICLITLKFLSTLCNFFMKEVPISSMYITGKRTKLYIYFFNFALTEQKELEKKKRKRRKEKKKN